MNIYIYIDADPPLKLEIFSFLSFFTRFLTTILTIKHITSDTVRLDKFNEDMMLFYSLMFNITG